MDDFIFTNTSESGSYDYSNSTFYWEYGNKALSIMHVATCVIIAIGLPSTLLAICGLYSLVRKDNPAPIFIINLLISDIIQFCCLIVEEALFWKDWEGYNISWYIHTYGLLVSVGFMVVIALERYLVIACPLWYRFRRTIKKSVGVCAIVWVLLPLTLHLIIFFSGFDNYLLVYLLPFPLLIFSVVGTLRALSVSISVPSDEKRRIVATLVLVLLTYMLLFLPHIILFLSRQHDMTLLPLSLMFVKLSPLADLVLYFFMKKGIIDKHLASLCCCRMESNDNSVSVPMATSTQ